ncbi:MAG: CoA transferase [Gammaproteobacteria bacterium]|nr:CoA transferase [Gammaproteobacteria bacterium]
MGSLSGLRVIELAHIMAGPVCGMMLADMGADVIKVEKVPGGDDSRRMVPPRVGDESAAFLMMNRNKRGMAVDLKKPLGGEILKRLVAGSDVLTENYRRGTLERMGLGYETLREANPGLIYCEISGFGRSGPYQDRGGFDLIAQGMSGLMSITGEGPGRPPVKCGAPITDITAGILAAMGVLGAYISRLKTGHGQRVDTSLFEAGAIHTYWQSAIAFATGEPPGAMGSAHPLNAPYEAFPTRDGWITVGAANQRNWEKLTEILDAPRLQDDPRFANNDSRMRNLPALRDVLTGLFKERTTRDWLKLCESAGVPAGPILDINEMHRDPQALARGMVQQVKHSTVGAVNTLGHPVHYSRTPVEIKRGAPTYGEHTREVLKEFEYSDAEIDRLIETRVVVGD